MSFYNNQFTQRMRQRWMKVLAKASSKDLEDALQKIVIRPDYEFLRTPETGMVMVRARTGGIGKRFNLGEITVTRCVIRTDDGDVGCSYVMGCDHRHAEYAALFDAMLQNTRYRIDLMEDIIHHLEAEQRGREETASRKSASTKVDFFTMVRGE
jgi:alpha-D-ribose 1-methylphosphonate 5-triphosphate synthase subunit PhnG